jgi:hypothetical protein
VDVCDALSHVFFLPSFERELRQSVRQAVLPYTGSSVAPTRASGR